MARKYPTNPLMSHKAQIKHLDTVIQQKLSVLCKVQQYI